MMGRGHGVDGDLNNDGDDGGVGRRRGENGREMSETIFLGLERVVGRRRGSFEEHVLLAELCGGRYEGLYV